MTNSAINFNTEQPALTPEQLAALQKKPGAAPEKKPEVAEADADMCIMAFSGVFGLSGMLHSAVEVTELVLDKYKNKKEEPLPNLTTKALKPNLGWTPATSSLEMQKKKKKKAQASNHKGSAIKFK